MNSDELRPKFEGRIPEGKCVAVECGECGEQIIIETNLPSGDYEIKCECGWVCVVKLKSNMDLN